MTYIQSVDFAILDFIRENLRCGFLDVFMRIFTVLGEFGAVWIAIDAGLVISKKYRRLGLVLAAALIMYLLAGEILLKNLVARPRPFIVNPAVVPAISPPSGYSFPSGHTCSSFTAAAVLARFSKKAAAAAIPAAVIIGLSRLYFYVHFPTDVLCGAIFGTALGLAAYKLGERFLQAEKAEMS